MRDAPVLETKNLSLSYGDTQVVNDVNIAFKEKSVTALIGLQDAVRVLYSEHSTA